MKNSELAQVKGIMKYKEELNKIKPLTQDTYTVAEAAEYFRCAKSQIKGYHNSYRDIFGDTIIVEGEKGKQKTIISKDGMFLMAILLSKKSSLAKELFDRVLSLLFGEEQVTLEETAATVELEEEPIKANKIRTDNLIKFEDIKKAKEDNELVECLKVEIGPEGIDVSPIKMTKKEADKLVSETESELGQNDSFEDMLDALANKIVNDIFGSEEDDEELEDEVDTLKSCNCKNCLDEKFDEACHDAKLTLLKTNAVLDMQKLTTKRYLEICDLLGVDKFEASIMIQNFIVNPNKDIDVEILNYLTDRKIMKRHKEIGIIEESIKLLSEEKYDNLEEAYLVLAQEMRYVLGQDLRDSIRSGNYNILAEAIVNMDEFDKAMIIINQILID